MNEVYIIELNVYHYYSNSDREDEEEKSVIGVFDTGRRAICYLRRFLSESDYCEYYGKQLQTTEDMDGYVSAKAVRRYKCGSGDGEQLVSETMKMTRFIINDCKPPTEEIIDLYC